MKGHFDRCIDFHTYPAPGLLIGVFMVDYALELLGATPGEKLYAVAETYKCAPDPLQVILNCTSGNHRLRIIPIGKFAITLNRPSTEAHTDGFRVFVDADKIGRYPVLAAWFRNEPTFKKQSMEQQLLDEIFTAKRDILSAEKVRVEVTPKQKWQSAKCPICGETVPGDMLEDGVCRGCGSMTYYQAVEAVD
ncbi:MAG: formylmethanofuran dehydrogenase subunit E family protein [Methanomicrobiaceae archaeon]|nr:formylmethanofuran dehydrogenase subunit E family protein [Methanomicrobiaceae archaeon]